MTEIEEEINKFRVELAKILKVDSVKIEVQRNNKPIDYDNFYTYQLIEDDYSSLGIFDIILISERGTHNIAYFKLSLFPGCSSIAISNAAYTYSNYRNMGVGSLMNLFRAKMASVLNFTTLLCTVQSNNELQIKIMKKNKWKLIKTTDSNKAYSKINMYSLNL